MAASIKHKIRIGTVFLFLLIVASGAISMYYLHVLRSDSRNILRNNYSSLKYAQELQALTDSIPSNTTALQKFDSLLQLQSANITEEGEQAATDSAVWYFNRVRENQTQAENIGSLRRQLNRVLLVNLKAIERKNLRAEQSAETAFTWMVAISVIVVVVGLTFAYNFPFIITAPIRKLLEGIREISAKNYSHRIHIANNDEFGRLAEAFNQMSERLEAFENSNLNKLIFEKARAEAVINSLRDASIGIDKNNRVLFANRQALSLLGMPGTELVGQPVNVVSGKNDLFRFLVGSDSSAPFKIVVAGRENYYTREKMEVDDGDSTVIVLKNITSFKELDTAKTNFIATISHELKTPLASSDLSLTLLEDTRIGQLSDEQRKLVDQLREDNRRMLRILSELLNMAQLEAGKLQLNITPVSLADAIRQSVQAVAVPAMERTVTIHTEMPAEELPRIMADPDKIGWVINNFLTNAIRYSPPGGRIYIHAYRNENVVTCEVADQGPGIPQGYTTKIFERYFQVPGRSDKKGSGIGLAICREFVEAMGGKIWVNSEPGKGSVFGFSLPAVS